MDLKTDVTSTDIMGNHRRGAQRRPGCSDSSGSDSSSSGDDDAPRQLLLQRYQQADEASGLAHTGLRLAALQELQEIFEQDLFTSSEKKVQQAVFEDLLLAAQQRDRCVLYTLNHQSIPLCSA